MSKFEKKIELAKKELCYQRYYESAASLIGYDRVHTMPVEGRPYMDQAQRCFQEDALRHLTKKSVRKTVNYLSALDERAFEDVYEKGCARELIKRYDKAVSVPYKLQAAHRQFCTEAQEVWQKAHREADFDLFAPYLEKQFEYQFRIAEAIDPDRDPFDVLLRQWNEVLNGDSVTGIIEEVKGSVKEIYRLAQERYMAVDSKIIKDIEVSKETIVEITQMVMNVMGFIPERGLMKEVLHPVCNCIGPRDSRPTTNYSSLWQAVGSTMHECGHGIYNYSSNEKAQEYGIWGGIMGTMHESQSRFYENMICRSREFWEFFYPMIQDMVPELKEITVEQFYMAFMKPEAGCKRLSADELTYNLHIIIRFEMERDYFAGRLSVKDFRDRWNELYEEYLGICPANDREGILQDVHWASGHIAYFQSYLLGDLYAGQLYNQISLEMPDLRNIIRSGQIQKVTDWLTDRIYQYGQAYTPEEVLTGVTGEKLNPIYYLEILRKKYLF